MAIVTPKQAALLVKQTFESGLIPFLKGSPGCGKSQIMHKFFRENNLKLIDHRISGSVPEDFSGLPDLSGEKARFIPFDIFPLKSDPIPEGYDGWGLFLDEYNSGSTETMAATYKLLLDRMVNQTPLHDNVAIGLAGNLETDKAIVNYLSSAIRSRVVTIQMKSHYPDWLEVVGLPYNYDPRIISYLENNPDGLNNFGSDPDAESYACERTWEFMNNHMKTHIHPNMKAEQVDSFTNLLGCTIGDPTARSFIAFIRNYADLVPLKEILRDPEEASIPSDHSLKWHTITNLALYVEESNFEKAITYALRYPLNFQVIFFKSVMQRLPALHKHPAFRKGAIKINQYLNQSEFTFDD